MSSKIPKAIQAYVVEALKEIPPEAYRLMTWTEDQRCWFDHVRDYHLALSEMLDDYFNGKGADLEKWKALDIDIDFVGAHRGYILAFYSLIQWRWDAVRYHPLVEKYKCKTPLDVLIRAITEGAIACLQPLFAPYHYYSPTQHRELRRLQSKQQKSALDIKKAKRIEADIDKLARPFVEFEAQIVEVCMSLQRKNATDRQLIKALQVALGDLERECTRGLHPRYGAIAYTLRNGELIDTG